MTPPPDGPGPEPRKARAPRRRAEVRDGAAPSAPAASAGAAAAAVARPPRLRAASAKGRGAAYLLDAQVGFVLRQVAQRHAAIFAERMSDELTTTQWAALAKLKEVGPSSQNLLGRLTAMDAATIKGVVDRLARRGLVETRSDPEDGRRLVVALSAEGEAAVVRATPRAFAITEETLAPLDPEERAQLLSLLVRMR